MLREECRLRVFENRVLRKIFVPKGEEVSGEWRKLHNEELNALYSSSNVTGMIKPTRMRWAGYVAYMGEGEVHTGTWWGNLWERDHLEDPGIDGKIIWRCMLRKWDGEWDMDWIDLALDRGIWRAPVKAVIDHQVP
jgi:hypothetical protein